MINSIVYSRYCCVLFYFAIILLKKNNRIILEYFTSKSCVLNEKPLSLHRFWRIELKNTFNNSFNEFL